MSGGTGHDEMHIQTFETRTRNYVFRDRNQNFFLSVSCFETRISFFQSWASRQERDREEEGEEGGKGEEGGEEGEEGGGEGGRRINARLSSSQQFVTRPDS